ncbi:hypothetical protein GUJ93_ZPchr0014g47017 [Zizania palustris]|uniref:Auxin response factor n=1 Tax=Zizania palustris TaxID=103762 RepID=A0A8J5TBU3_ZIZPA|nr:hypothetical protein GUJ93_ZPchr0014g47017 [Zizania palustris]
MLTFKELAGPTASGGGGGGGGGEGTVVDEQLWMACAGSMCSVPPVGAAVYYFPQGHAEQASADVGDLLSDARVPALVPCRVAGVRFMADAESDEVFAKLCLVPLCPGEAVVDVGQAQRQVNRQKPMSLVKTLTQSDANNGGGFSVPRYCADNILPELDYNVSTTPLQYVYAKDVHGVEWKFRHIYRGTPRRHLLTTGWSGFVNQKKLLAGDSIVFMSSEGGADIHVGIRRAKREFCGIGGGDDGLSSLPAWDQYRGLMRGNANSTGRSSGGTPKGKVPPENVLTAARMAACGQPFEVLYYPRASTPEFCVRAAAVRAAMQVLWCPGMRFKMAFETEDSSRISCFMGTVTGVHAADPIRWPRSPWRLLQVTWDEPELLQNVKRVCPWLVEVLPNMPNLPLPSFSPPRKKPRIPPYTKSPRDSQLLNPAFPPNQLAHGHQDYPHPHRHHGLPFLPFPESSAQPSGIQGARHAQFASSFQDFHPGVRLPPANHAAPPRPPRIISTDLTIGGSLDDAKPAGFLLFGRTILTEEQMKSGSSGGTTASPAATHNHKRSPNWETDKVPNASEGSDSGVIEGSPTDNTASWRFRRFGDNSRHASEYRQEAGPCKVFVESDAVGRNLDLSALSSFEELYTRLSDMFIIDSAELKSHVLYRSAAGEVKNVGDEPFWWAHHLFLASIAIC